MKVLLINPPSRFWLFPPLGLMYIASVLKQENHFVQILDMTAFPEQSLSSTLRCLNPDVVGLTCTSQTFQAALEVAKQVKKYSQSIHVIFGGSHPSSMPEETLCHEEIDAVICGEGEMAMLEYLSGPFNKRIIIQQPMDINKIPLPSRNLLDMSRYETAGSILTSRGCPFQCNYCVHHVSGYKWRGRKPEEVVAEIEILANTYHLKEIHIVDDNFSFDIVRAKQIMQLIIKRNMGLHFYFFNGLRADRIDVELTNLMKKAGTQLISFGLESANEQVRKNIGKAVSLDQTASALRLVHALGIKTRVSVMVGNVGDSFASVMETIQWVRKNNNIDDAEFCLCTAYPNTPLYDWVKTNGKILAIPEDQPTYFLDMGMPSFETSDFSVKERIKALRIAQAMVYRKNALRNKSILNFKIKNVKTYLLTAKIILFKESPKRKFRVDKK